MNAVLKKDIPKILQKKRLGSHLEDDDEFTYEEEIEKEEEE